MSLAVRISFVLAMLVAAVGLGSLFARIGNRSFLRAAVAPTVVTQQSAIPATAIPTGTPLVPTVVPSPSNSVEQFIRMYFQEINSRNYENTWSLLSEAFKASRNGPQHGGYQGYVDFWNTVARVEIVEIRILEQSNQSAEVFVVANYHYQNGATTTGEQTFHLIYEFTRNTWLFDVPR
ncbi:MAG TPA: hypothetical protein VK900_18255 [Anaerolineales bacterium]|nr:hypothetical protein [Anaerolineales bacterium]